MRGRGKDASNGCTIAAVSVRVQDDFRHARSQAAVDSLLKANRIERVADGFVAKTLMGVTLSPAGRIAVASPVAMSGFTDLSLSEL